ncbi:MAG TPA: glycosyltransferase family 4 protein [Tepidisphaeraceae bacterium]
MAASFQTRRCVEMLGRQLGEGFETEVVTMGIGGSYSNAVVAGLALRRGRRRWDVIHAWGGRALGAASLAGTPVIFSPDSLTRVRSLRWLRAMQSHRAVEVICPTATLRRLCVERGVPISRCHLIRPGIEFARIKRRRDSQLRTALGFSEQDYVILAAGESSRAANHRLAVWTVAIAHLLDERYKLLVWGRGGALSSVEHFSRRAHQPEMVSFAEQRLGRATEFEELLPAADMVLATANGPVDPLPIQIAMAAALPIVSTVTYTIGELLEDHHTALLAAKDAPKAIAQRIIELRNGASLQWTLADMARTEAYEYFSMSRFLNQYRAAYQQAAKGEAVQVPQSAPGAGMRFHGRA